MSEKPIIFSGPMVRAILDGTKTQDRRVLKGRKAFADMLCAHRIENVGGWPIAREYDRSWPIRTGYAPGMKLWVRETFTRADGAYRVAYRADGACGAWGWDGDGNPLFISHGRVVEASAQGNYGYSRYGGRWRPSIHMPRWASRISLLVTAVRVERLREISEADAIAEGHSEELLGDQGRASSLTAAGAFARLWDSINAKRPGCSWTDNPWLAAISFEVMR